EAEDLTAIADKYTNVFYSTFINNGAAFIDDIKAAMKANNNQKETEATAIAAEAKLKSKPPHPSNAPKPPCSNANRTDEHCGAAERRTMEQTSVGQDLEGVERIAHTPCWQEITEEEGKGTDARAECCT
ncbi:hypothetical protein HDU93_008482, partial [Gonapodya sp. JEL0774]